MFSSGKIINLPNLLFNGEKIKIVFDYSLHIQQYIPEKPINAQRMSAKSALYVLLKKCRTLDVPLDFNLSFLIGV